MTEIIAADLEQKKGIVMFLSLPDKASVSTSCDYIQDTAITSVVREMAENQGQPWQKIMVLIFTKEITNCRQSETFRMIQCLIFCLYVSYSAP
jgi:hypothetical protein